MKTVSFRPGLWLPHDPDQVEDYEIDVTAWLDGNTLDTAIVAQAVSVAAAAPVIAGNLVQFRVSGGVAGELGRVTIRFTATNGRQNDCTILFMVAER